MPSCQLSCLHAWSMATESTPRRWVGRPNKLPEASFTWGDSFVTVESPTQSSQLTYSQYSGCESTETAVLCIPNCLLQCWYTLMAEGSERCYVDYVNDRILGNIIKLDGNSECLGSALHRRSNNLHYKLQRAWGSPQRRRILEASTRVFVLEGETLRYSELEQQFAEMTKDAQDLQETNTHLQACIDQLYVDMAMDYDQFQATIEGTDPGFASTHCEPWTHSRWSIDTACTKENAAV